METWMWISLYCIQTLVGAVLWRRFCNKKGELGSSAGSSFVTSSVLIPNIIAVVVVVISLILMSIDFLAGIKNKETEEIKCTGNNGNGCFLDSCGHNCGCQGIGDKK